MLLPHAKLKIKQTNVETWVSDKVKAEQKTGVGSNREADYSQAIPRFITVFAIKVKCTIKALSET